MNDAMTFKPGVLGTRDSLKGFHVIASDGRGGHVSSASYAPGESYLVVTLGRFSRKHHVVPAGAVTAVEDGEARVALSRTQIRQLHDVPQPDIAAGALTGDQVLGDQTLFSAMDAFARVSGGRVP